MGCLCFSAFAFCFFFSDVPSPLPSLQHACVVLGVAPVTVPDPSMPDPAFVCCSVGVQVHLRPPGRSVGVQPHARERQVSFFTRFFLFMLLHFDATLPDRCQTRFVEIGKQRGPEMWKRLPILFYVLFCSCPPDSAPGSTPAVRLLRDCELKSRVVERGDGVGILLDFFGSSTRLSPDLSVPRSPFVLSPVLKLRAIVSSCCLFPYFSSRNSFSSLMIRLRARSYAAMSPFTSGFYTRLVSADTVSSGNTCVSTAVRRTTAFMVDLCRSMRVSHRLSSGMCTFFGHVYVQARPCACVPHWHGAFSTVSIRLFRLLSCGRPS